MADEFVPHRMSELQHAAQRPLCSFSPREVCLINDQNVGDLQDASLDRLDIVSQTGSFDHQSRMRQPGYIHLRLPRSNGFDQDNFISSRIQNLDHTGSGARQPAQRAARGHRSDENASITRQIAHANAVSEQGASSKWTGRIHRHDCYLRWFLRFAAIHLWGAAQIQGKLVYECGFTSSRSTCNPNQVRLTGG